MREDRKLKKLKRKRKVKKTSRCVAIQNQRMKMFAEADGLRKLWCVRCKWKSTPCVLHFNLTSFHCHTRSRLWHSMLSQCVSNCVSFFLRALGWLFPRNNDKSHLTCQPFLRPNLNETREKPMIKHTHYARKKDTFFISASFYTRVLFIDAHVGGNVLSWAWR